MRQLHDQEHSGCLLLAATRRGRGYIPNFRASCADEPGKLTYRSTLFCGLARCLRDENGSFSSPAFASASTTPSSAASIRPITDADVCGAPATKLLLTLILKVAQNSQNSQSIWPIRDSNEDKSSHLLSHANAHLQQTAAGPPEPEFEMPHTVALPLHRRRGNPFVLVQPVSETAKTRVAPLLRCISMSSKLIKG